MDSLTKETFTKSTRNEVRGPTEDEKNQIGNWMLETYYIDRQPEDVEHVTGLIDDACIAVFPHYITDSPGYAGLVYVIVWPAGPEQHTVLTVDHLQSGALHNVLVENKNEEATILKKKLERLRFSISEALDRD